MLLRASSNPEVRHRAQTGLVADREKEIERKGRRLCHPIMKRTPLSLARVLEFLSVPSGIVGSSFGISQDDTTSEAFTVCVSFDI